MLVKDVMSTCMAECTEDMALEKVYELLTKCDHACVVVIESKAHRIPIGIITERTICDQVIARGRSVRGLSAANVMSAGVITAREQDDIFACVHKYIDAGGSPIVVVGDNRNFRGILPRAVLDATYEISRAFEARPARPSTIPEIPAFGWVQ